MGEGKFWTRALSVVSGCTPCSPGCVNCWASRLIDRFPVLQRLHSVPDGTSEFDIGCRRAVPFSTVMTHEEVIDAHRQWRKPQRIAVGWFGDLWHPCVPFSFIDRFRWAARSGVHRYLYLTKRSLRLRGYFDRGRDNLAGHDGEWFGVTGENQALYSERVRDLCHANVGGAHRWAILEPLLGPINLGRYVENVAMRERLEWVVVGAETGPGARPCQPEWVQDIVCQCAAAGVPCWVKAAPARPDVGGVPVPWPREMPAALVLPWEVLP